MVGPQTKLELQRYTDGQDSVGGVVRTWAKVKTMTGVFQTTSASESYAGQKITAFYNHSFYCDTPKDITVTERDRFVLGDRIFNIVMVDDMPRNWLRIRLAEVK